MNGIRKWGWRRQLPDHRDKLFAFAPKPTGKPLPPSVDLRETNLLSAVVDQEDVGSCTANAGCEAFWHTLARMGQPMESGVFPWFGSRLFLYLNTRLAEGVDPLDDCGATIRGTVKSIAQAGVCPESEWPYVASKFGENPPMECYTHAEKHQGLIYREVRHDAHNIKSAIASGLGVMFGFSVYESFTSQKVAETGQMPIPRWTESLLGGHAVYLVGYNDALAVGIVQNSWGEGWGRKGFFTMPYEVLFSPSYASDFWVIEKVEAEHE